LSAAPVHVIGASGRSGAQLCGSLSGDFVPVVRNPATWAATGLPGSPRIADLHDAPSLRAALSGAARIVNCAHARHTEAVIAAAPPEATLVLLGSTRKFTNWPDEHGNGVKRGEAAFLASGRRGVMLKRLPIVPLPGGGSALVQPIHQNDVTAAIRAALAVDWDGPHSLTIAGPEPLKYADFVRAIAAAAGLGRPRILSVPAGLLLLAAPLTRFLPGVPTIEPAEIRRLLEDKAFDIAPMRRILGIEPRPLAEGLARTFAQSQNRQTTEGER
jgi:uncharacterized protein YbjT (DUF2867 family)